MNKKQIIDFVISIFLIICGTILLIFPLLHFINIKIIFLAVLFFYGMFNLIQFILTRKSRDYEGLLTTIVSLITFIIAWKLSIKETPLYLAMTLFIWIIGMSLIKLKKADYYHDRKNKIWILKITNLIFFILTGILATINLYYDSEVQVLVLGFFYLFHGMLELLDPLTLYLLEISQPKITK